MSGDAASRVTALAIMRSHRSVASGTLRRMETTATPTSVEELVKAAARGVRHKYVFFWGHTPSGSGVVGAECLSQWAPTPFTVEGTDFATAEHYMMWRKARLFGDDDACARVLKAGHPKQVKAIGQQVRGFTDELWQANRFDLVTDGNVAKFGQNPELRSFLLGTGSRVLVEASPMDRIWGVGLGVSDERVQSPEEWRGLNLLGFALMRARDILRAEG
jgi:ribA/ribD-fused uncharacterized protein